MVVYTPHKEGGIYMKIKNYYKLLGIKRDATEEEIDQAFFDTEKEFYTDDNNIDPERADEYNELIEAYNTLRDPELRAQYDENIKIKTGEKLKEFSKSKKGRIALATIGGVAIFGAGLLTGYWLFKGDKVVVENPPTVSETVNNEAPTLTAENFEEVTQAIVKDNQEKGLDIDPAFVRSALFITNIDYLKEDDIKALFGDKDLNMIEEIQNMYNYTSAVGTHNCNGNNYISLTPLAYDQEDKAILNELDVELQDLMNDLNNGVMTEEEFQASFKYVTEFYTGAGTVTTDGFDYNNYSLTSGAGLLSEQYWPMFSVTYANSEMVTSQNMNDIKALSEGTKDSEAVINGSKYLGAIINHESLNCLAEDEKTLTKTQ
mgnify:FL=1